MKVEKKEVIESQSIEAELLHMILEKVANIESEIFRDDESLESEKARLEKRCERLEAELNECPYVLINTEVDIPEETKKQYVKKKRGR